MAEALERWDVRRTVDEAVKTFYRAAPGGVPTTEAFSQAARWDALDTDREAGVIRDADHPFSVDGGLAVLYGNLAEEGLHRLKPLESTHPSSSFPVPRACSRVRMRR